MAPVIQQLAKCSWADVTVLATAQHRSMLDQTLAAFDINIDLDLNVMREGQNLASLTARLLQELDHCFDQHRPDFVLAQGDTTTVFAAGLACFYRNIPFGHVEAGLRTFDLKYPFPEEFNRVATSLTAQLHFAPTAKSRQNLLEERVPTERIFTTGNTVIDALHWMTAQNPPCRFNFPSDSQVILLTAHRRENFGEPMQEIFQAVHRLLAKFPNLHFVYPVHPNPAVHDAAHAAFNGIGRVYLCDPLAYSDLVACMLRCDLVLTDSGGLQEEAPAVGKPVLVLRGETERPEAVECGVAKLVGTDADVIFAEVSKLLSDTTAYEEMAQGASPYGDGKAAQRICDAVHAYLLTG